MSRLDRQALTESALLGLLGGALGLLISIWTIPARRATRVDPLVALRYE